MEAPARDLAALATIALLVAAVLQVMLLARHRREVEARLDEAHDELDLVRERLAEATRPSAQFARMHLRETAVFRIARLRRAMPYRRRLTDVTEGARDLAR